VSRTIINATKTANVITFYDIENISFESTAMIIVYASLKSAVHGVYFVI
jgi:hypothetical protein